MTNEEALTYHVAREIRSYRELPKILYHVQVKERDEPRPRPACCARGVHDEGLYSFDRDDDGLDAATSCTSARTRGSSTARACAGTRSRPTSTG